MRAHVENVFKGTDTNNIAKSVSPLFKYLATLCALLAFFFWVISSPFVDKNIYKNYIDNLQTLKSLSSLLVQDYLLVRYDQVRHFDYLESDLQKMTMSANLTAMVPAYVRPKVKLAIQHLGDDYLNQLESIRNYVELSKRSIGLLRNSNTLLTKLTAQLASELTKDVDIPISPLKAGLTIELIYAVKDDNNERIQTLTENMLAIDDVSPELLRQIKLHSDMIASYETLLIEADTYILQHATALNQPRKINVLYRDEYTAVRDQTDKLIAVALFFGILSLALLSINACKCYGFSRRNSDKRTLPDVCVNDDTHNLSKVA